MSVQYEPVEVREDERRIAEKGIERYTQWLYRESNRTFTPCYPWVLVWVLDKEQVLDSGIILPQHQQNKTVHEGIVVATWKPFTKEVRREFVEAENWLATMVFPKQPIDKLWVAKTVEKKSQFIQGQHILFPHWAGAPLHGFDDKRWRVVKEEEWSESKDGGIFAEVEYSPVHTKSQEKLRKMLQGMLPIGDESIIDLEQFSSMVAAKIEEQFLVVDKDSKSVTLSGR